MAELPCFVTLWIEHSSTISAPMAPPPTSSSFLRPPPLPHHPHPRLHFRPPSATFRVSEILGGRGLCNGEVGVRKELDSGSSASTTTTTTTSPSPSTDESPPPPVDLDAFDKEMMGLTGGFPGGEVGLKDFVAKNPPPPRSSKKPDSSQLAPQATTTLSAPPRTPELPLFLPGMVVLVKNPNNAYYMYCGIVQRVTDGKVAVLFEGGIWDRLITFKLDELEGRDKGPPMANPKSVVLEELVAQLEEDEDDKEVEKEPEGATAAA